ncbi:MAG: LemA family protein [Spirochaetales bacterium]|nr:LemA family protein [Spirochaetales bacterium]
MSRVGKRSLMIVLAAAVALALSGCGYNVIQGYEEAVFKEWGDLNSTLQRRADLVPNLVETVKGAAAFERETLDAVVSARARATSVQVTPEMLNDQEAMSRFAEAQGDLGSSLKSLLLVVENYPTLQATQAFRDLQVQLEGTENRINTARQRYNEAVETFNFSIRRFPYSLTNRLLLKLERKAYFEAEASAQQAPQVQF